MPPIRTAAHGHPPTGTVGQASTRTPTTVGTNLRGRHATAAQPVLRNPVFASLAPRGHERTGRTPALADATFRGAFAQSRFAREWRRHHHHHHFGVVLGFVGPLFWPYAYADFVDYTYWPYAYDTFWPYAFDDAYLGIYGGYAPEYDAPEQAYAYAGAPATGYAYAARTTATGTTATGRASASHLRICSGQPADLVNFPIDRIRQQVSPDQEQEKLLDDLKSATAKAVDLLQAACPSELPSTPPGRMAAMRSRIEAMLKAVQVVRPALDQFYHSLSDEQKERFNALDQNSRPPRAPDIERLCSGQSGGVSASLPVSRIERTLHLSAGQHADLRGLTQATATARNLLETSCQPQQTLTPTGRLAAMQNRLTAVLQAVDTVQPELAKFYNSLRDEQKARFDRLARPA